MAEVARESAGASAEVSVVDTVDPARRRRDARWARLKSLGRLALFAIGAAAVVALVVHAGADRVWNTLARAGVWLPLVMFLELGFATMDVVSLRLMYGERGARVPASVWLRSGIMAYGVMVLLPAGRAGGEVMRAASMAPYVGGPRAAAAATVLQGVTLWGNTLISVPCYAAVAIASGYADSLALLVAGNGFVTAVAGTFLLLGARSSRLGGWLGRRIKALAPHGARFDESLRELPALPLSPIAAAFVGRALQAAQYGIILLAVGGALTVESALVAQAIHLVGAGFGDMVPNQVGVTEGAYHLFAANLGLEDAVAQAISIALVHRVCQTALAATSLAIGAVWKPAALESRADTGSEKAA
jgi:hypothetical protein